MVASYSQDEVNALVERVFLMDDITWGGNDQPFIVRYRGKLNTSDSERAYDLLSEGLARYELTPLFREEEDGRHAIFLLPSRPKPKVGSPTVNLVLFILTVLSVLFTGTLYSLGNEMPKSFAIFWQAFLSGGIPFTVSMIAILGSHELAHYFIGKHHGVLVTLPYFLPLPYPITLWGTLGAFINMKQQPKNRKQLLDIGIAGPLVGFVVSVIVLFIGLKLSTLDTLPTTFPPNMGLQIEGNSIIYLLLKYLAFGKLLPEPAQFSISPALHWLQYFFTATPYPLGGTDVMLSPVAWAGWAGLLVTSLNLIPAGQLDGGHIFFVLFGRKTARKLRPVVLILLVTLGLVWIGWWLWAALIFFMGRVYAEPMDEITPLDKRRRILGIIALIVFLLTLTPVPLSLITGV